MQRKNSVLKSHKSGFALIMAIAVIVVLSTIMALSLALTAKTTKSTNDLYLYEQSVLLAHSATEYALLRIAEDGACSHYNDLNFKADLNDDGSTLDDIYDINITIKYVYTDTTTCSADKMYATVTTPEQNGSALIDVTVSVNDLNVTTEPIRFFKRTIEKL